MQALAPQPGLLAFSRARGALLRGHCRKLARVPGPGRCRVSQQAGRPAVGLGGRMPLQDRAKVGGGWGRVLAGGWVKWLIMIPKALRQTQDERRGGSVVSFAFSRARGALLQCYSRETIIKTPTLNWNLLLK